MFRKQIERNLQFWERPSRWAYLILAPWLIGAAFMIYQSRHFDDVAARQRIAEGRIVAHEPQNHDRYGYAFAVDGRAFKGWDSPVNRALTLGETVQVFYDPADPETNALTEFAERSRDAFGPVPLIVFASLGLLGAIFIVRRQARLGKPL
jgi:hypothetical protein